MVPIYEWWCKDCKVYTEVEGYRPETDGPGCPDCGLKTQRVYSMSMPVFKGSGFYVTDNKK